MSLSTSEILHGPNLKIRRAQKHISDLNKGINAYLSTKPYRLMTLGEPKADKETHFIEEKEPIPEELGLIIGDAVHNLRSALDILMFSLVSPKSTSPHQIQFPFARRAESLVGTINSRQAHLAGEKVVAEIKALEPYPGGNKWLNGLNDLDVSDKHKIIIPAISTAAMTGTQFNEILPSIEAHPTQTLFVPYNTKFIYQHRGSRRDRLANRNNIRAGKYERENQPAFEIVFGEGGPFGLHSVIPVLTAIRHEVVLALGKIASAAAK